MCLLRRQPAAGGLSQDVGGSEADRDSRQLPIGVFPVADHPNVDSVMHVVDGVHDAIMPYANAPQVRRPLELSRGGRPGLCSQPFEGCDNPLRHWARQFLQFLSRGADNGDSVLDHARLVRRLPSLAFTAARDSRGSPRRDSARARS